MKFPMALRLRRCWSLRQGADFPARFKLEGEGGRMWAQGLPRP